MAHAPPLAAVPPTAAPPAPPTSPGPARRAFGGAAGAVVHLAGMITLGLVAFAPLGAAAPALGIPAAFTTIGVAGLVAAVAGRRVVPAFAPGFATALTLAGLVAVLAGDPASFRPDGTVLAGRVLAATGLAVLLCGLLQIAMAAAGLGRMARFAPTPVLAGFMSGIALLLINAQVPALLGLAPAQWRAEGLAALSWHSLGPLALGLATLACIPWLTPRVPRVPGPLLALVLGFAAYHLCRLLWPGLSLGPTLGGLPPLQDLLHNVAGIADPAVPAYLQHHAVAIGSTAALLALVGTLDSTLALRSIDQQFETRHDPARELRALGLANVCGGLLTGLPGGLLRALGTSVAAAGGRGRAAGIGAATSFLALYLLGRGLLEVIPTAVLAGIMVFIGWMMFDRPSLQLLRNMLTRKAGPESWVSVIIVAAVCATTFFKGVALGVAVGMALAMLQFIRSTNQTLVRHQLSGVQRPSRRVWPAKQEQALQALRQRITVIGLEGELYFGNAAALLPSVDAPREDGSFLVIDLHRVGLVDESGAAMLRQMATTLKRQGTSVLLAGLRLHGPAGRALTTFGLPPGGPVPWFDDVDRAVEHAERQLLAAEALQPLPASLTAGTLFHGLSEADSQALVAAMERRLVPAGTWLFREGEPGDALYMVIGGDVSVIGANGQRLHSPAPGQIFGELALMDNGPRSAGAYADSEVELRVLTTGALAQLRASRPALVIRILENIARHLSDRLRLATRAWTEAAA